MSPNVLGIDPSLTSLGLSYRGHEGLAVTTALRTKDKGIVRLDYLYRTVANYVASVKPELVVYEGYAMGKFANRQYDLAELGGLLKYLIWGRNIPILLVPPACLKLFATGKGNADKDSVRSAMAADRGKLFSTDDEADAYGLMRMGEGYISGRQLPRALTHYKHRALAGCSMLCR